MEIEKEAVSDARQSLFVLYSRDRKMGIKKADSQKTASFGF